MAFEGNTGLQVASQYGARNTGVSVGAQTTKTGLNILSMEFTGKGIAEKFLPPFVLPARAKVLRAYWTQDESFEGVTALIVGGRGNESTHGLAVEPAILTQGKIVWTIPAADLKGDWQPDNNTQVGREIGFVATGTANPLKGKATLTVEYIYNSRDDAAWTEYDPATRPTYRPQR